MRTYAKYTATIEYVQKSLLSKKNTNFTGKEFFTCWIFRSIIFIWTQTYREGFKSTLVYFKHELKQ